MKYQLRPLEVEAIQFTSDNSEELFRWARERSKENMLTEVVLICELGLNWERVPVGVEIVAPKYLYRLLPGDYLVLMGSRFMAIAADIFENSYTEVK